MTLNLETPQMLHLDAWLAITAKPAGLLTHPSPLSPGEPSCMTVLRGALKSWVYPVHRLDRATSGALAFGRTPEAASVLSAAMRDGLFKKRYVAVVRGRLEGGGTIDRPLAEEAGEVPKPAVTHWRSLATVELPWAVRPYHSARYSLVELTTDTGRTHQLRRHLRGIAHPIVGDTRYGDGAHNAAYEAETGIGRLLLHAVELSLPHPHSGVQVTVTAPPDEAFARSMALFAARPSTEPARLV